MRILHVYKDYFPIMGGIENHVKTLAEAQAASDHEVTVLVTNPGTLDARETINGVRVIRARRVTTAASTPLSIDLILTLRSLRADITHLHFPYPIGEIGQLATGRGRPYVITYHSDVVRQRQILALYRPLLLRVLRNSQRIMATSDRYANSSLYLQLFREKCSIVPLSVDPEPFAGPPPLIQKGDRPTVLFVGRHRYYKGVDDLLRAFQTVDGRLLIGGDGPMRPAWEQLAAELNLGDRVQFLGDIDDDELPCLYASADLFVLPANSRAEAFGKVLLEAMATGLPCITTELGTGTSFVVQHNVTGLVVPPNQPEALAGAVSRLLADPGLREQMGARGRERVLREFTEQKMVAAVGKVYNGALNGPELE